MNDFNTCGASADAITDSYKVGNCKTYGMDVLGSSVEIVNSYSNFTPRKNAYMNFCEQSDGKLVVYGTRHVFQFIVDSWDTTFFNETKLYSVGRFTRRLKNHFGSIEDHKGLIQAMEELYDLGYLPIEVRAIDEGTRYPIGLPLFTVKATNPKFAWLVNYLETISSNLIWPMVNTATKAEQFYLQAKHFGEISAPKAVVDQWLPICVHEFGLRGYWGPEAGIRVSSAHNLFFLGSDTIGVLDFFEDHYDTDPDDGPVAVSVRASEHADISRMLSLFRHLAQDALDKEGPNAILPWTSDNSTIQVVEAADVLDNTEYYVLRWFAENSTGVMSYVSDTENYYRLINIYAKRLLEVIENRKVREDGQPPIFVFRPDSSRRTPLTVICGYRVVDIPGDLDSLGVDECFISDGKYYLYEKGDRVEITKEEAEGSLVSLWNTFGGEEVETEAGMMKLINPAVGLIYGEAISQTHQAEIYTRMIEMGFSAVNILMGKGSYATLEGSTRDLFSMSYKQTFSEALVDGETVNLEQQKTPMGDVSKKSAKGLLKVDKVDGEFTLLQEVSEEDANTGYLTLLLKDGFFEKCQTLDDIKATYAE